MFKMPIFGKIMTKMGNIISNIFYEAVNMDYKGLSDSSSKNGT